jgi:hypothetical protein
VIVVFTQGGLEIGGYIWPILACNARITLFDTRPTINIDRPYSDFELSLRHGVKCLIKATIFASVLSPAS